MKRLLSALLVSVLVLSLGSSSFVFAQNTQESKINQLQSLLDEIDTMDGDDYTEETWKPLKTERDSVGSADAYLQSAVSKLKSLSDALEMTDLKKLQTLLDKIDALNEEDYTEESWTQLKQARDSVKDPTQLPEQYIQQVIDRLQSLVDALEITDLKELQTLLEEIDALN